MFYIQLLGAIVDPDESKAYAERVGAIAFLLFVITLIAAAIWSWVMEK